MGIIIFFICRALNENEDNENRLAKRRCKVISGFISKAKKIGAALLVVFLISEAFGFCLTRFQFVNEEHLLNIAFQKWIPNRPSGERYLRSFYSENKYFSLDELRLKNPGCCMIKKSGIDIIDGSYISIFSPFRRFYRVELRFEGEQLFSYFNCCEELITTRGFSSGDKEYYYEFD